MRRVAAPILILFLAAACTTADPAELPSTTSTILGSVAPPATTSPVEQCRDVEVELGDYLAALNLDGLDFKRPKGDGPLNEFLPRDYAFAEELGVDCWGVFYADSEFGEMAQIVAAWDDEQTFAVLGGFTKLGSLDADGEGLRIDMDHGPAVVLHAAGDHVRWSQYHAWWVSDSLGGIIAAAGDDPMAALSAWNRAGSVAGDYPVLTIAQADSWGGSGPVYRLYPDGLLLVETTGNRPLATFENQVKAYSLPSDAVASLEEQLLATGVVDGEDFDPPTGIIDAGSVWFTYRYEDVTYFGSVYAPRLGEPSPARQTVIDLFESLEQMVTPLESTTWTPESIMVRVAVRGPGAEGNVVPWNGSFDLSAAAEEVCTYLEGNDAESYLDDVALVNDEYRNSTKTVFEYPFATFSVIATALLPGDTAEQLAALRSCRTTDVRQVDPVLSAWLWDTRAIGEYQIELEVLSCLFDQCDESAIVLNGKEPVELPPYWGDFLDSSGAEPGRRLISIDDLFTLANHEDLELESLTTDGIVGIPLELVVANSARTAKLMIRSTRFDTDAGILEVEYDDNVGISLIPTGLDEWMLEGY